MHDKINLRDLAPPLRKPLERLIKTDEYKHEGKTLRRLRAEAKPITLAIWPLGAAVLLGLYFYQPDFFFAAALFALISILLPDLHTRPDRLSWTIGDGHLTAKSRNEEVIDLGFFDIDGLYVLEDHYYFVASAEKITSWPAPNYNLSRRSFYIPFTAFESEDDRIYFESLFPDWKIKRKRSHE